MTLKRNRGAWCTLNDRMFHAICGEQHSPQCSHTTAMAALRGNTESKNKVALYVQWSSCSRLNPLFSFQSFTKVIRSFHAGSHVPVKRL